MCVASASQIERKYNIWQTFTTFFNDKRGPFSNDKRGSILSSRRRLPPLWCHSLQGIGGTSNHGYGCCYGFCSIGRPHRGDRDRNRSSCCW